MSVLQAVLRYIIRVLIALDQVGTALLGGWPDETLSSYAYRLDAQGKPFGFMRRVIDTVFFWQQNHCYLAYLDEAHRRQFPPILRNQL
jgi:hypothetical protein